ncbi:hypothetical protein, partial [Bacteroides intestinalis]|uniref:hypothetical protein n=1 Tax=Bacteroides intestinalis TaxID=329854 RepID=UPI001E314583
SCALKPNEFNTNLLLLHITIPKLYPRYTCSVVSPLTGTSEWRNYGLGTEQVHPKYSTDSHLTPF